ncbi:MAG: ribonuclease E inhibitor RraB [Cellvibrio sp.]
MSISLEQITEFFNDTRSVNLSEQSDWSIDEQCRWSYYFLDASQDNLVALAKHLEEKGYEVVDIDEAENVGDFFLQVDCVETHTPESLHALSQELEKIAEQFNVRDFDGMDVTGLDE